MGKVHKFVVIHFQTSTYCNFCGKKIWLKTAFQCSECDMVCHKKCVEKCQLATSCSRNKSKVKLPIPPLPIAKPPARTNQPSAGYLRSHLEPTVGKDVERKRYISAPDESHSDSESTSLMSHHQASSQIELLPRPLSSAALDTLIDSPTRAAATNVEHLVSNITGSTTSVGEDEEKLLELCARARRVQNSDELVVTKAKNMGKELFAELAPDARKNVLDSLISRLQSEIDTESENRAELVRRAQTTADKKLKLLLEARMEKSYEKLDSMAVLMLHYCAGLQHCLDQEEIERVKQMEDEEKGLREEVGECTSDGVLEPVSTNADNVLMVDYSDAAAESLENEPLPAAESLENEPLPAAESLENEPLPADESLENEPLPADKSLENEPLPADESLENEPLPADGSLENEPLPADESLENEPLPADGDRKTDEDEELLIIEAELTNEIEEEETVEDVMVVSDNEVVFSAHQTSHSAAEVEKDMKPECDEDEGTAADTTDLPTSCTEQNLEIGEFSAQEAASVEICSKTVCLDSATV